MFITIDGLSGSGKSTQCDAVGKSLGWRVWQVDELRVAFHFFLDKTFRSRSNIETVMIPYNISLTYALIKSRIGNFILDDHFWRIFWIYYKDHGKEKTEPFIQFFIKMLRSNIDEVPIASFYLSTPSRFRFVRKVNRYSNHLIDSNFHIDQNTITANTDDENDILLEYFEWLKEFCDFIHIIDGTQSIETITARIVEVTNDSILHQQNS